jgi:anti-sigma B factor antagonist
MTIYVAAQIKPALFAALARHPQSALDLSAVNEIDTAGLQLLLAARRQAIGRPLTLAGSSSVVLAVLRLCSLSDWLPESAVGRAE